MFSIVIPLYNKELSVKDTVQSVLDQSYINFQIVIVDDGSTDGSLSVAKSILDPRIKIVEKKNGGVSSARNLGIKLAEFEWIAFLDADDLWESNHLATLFNMIENNPNDRVFCTSYIRSNQQLIKKPDDTILIIEDYFQEALTKGHFFWTSVTCIHVSVFNKIGSFNEDLSRGEDLELWTRIGRRYRFIKSALVTAIYRIEAENRSDLKFNMEKSRLYNYDFSFAAGNSEIKYYKKQIVNVLKSFLLKRELSNFIALKRKHRKFVSYFDLFKN